jgi:signal transduction histidine kinase/CheY-like chemotaxis protein
MLDFFRKLFDSDFMPHGHCYLMRPEIIWLHVISDALITLAYCSIPVTLVYFIRKRTDMRFHWIFILFAIFIFACGATHFMEIWSVWHGTYRLSGVIKAVTAVASVLTAVMLARLVPVALKLPSPEEHARTNAALVREIEDRRRAQDAILAAHQELESRVRERTAELARKNEILDSILINIDDAVIVADEQESFLVFNPAAERMFPSGATEARSDEWSARYGLYLPDRVTPFPTQDLPLARAVKGESVDGVTMFVRPDQTTDGLWVMVTGRPLRNRAGDLKGGVVVCKDITASKRGEELRGRLEAQLRQSQKMEAIGTLAGGIAHDFNNILASIGWCVELIRADLGPAHPSAETIQHVLVASQRASRLVRQIMTFSRQQEQQREVLPLQPVIREALDLLRATLPANIHIELDLDPGAPPVVADPTQVHQVAMNLCANAWRAMGEKGGRLQVKLAPVMVDAEMAATSADLKPGDYVRLSVIDDGEGMEPAVLERIFEPFFTTRHPSQGTGLGLAVVHGIVRAHHGAITVTSQPGKGAVFNVYFPAHDPVEFPVLSPPGEAPRGQGGRILFVDDENSIMLVGSRLLTRLGYVVTACDRAAGALEIFRAAPGDFDLVLTDLSMPELSGLELAAQIRAIRPDLPVILTTGFAGTLTPEDVRAHGICEVLPKPVSVTTLEAAIARALKRG